MPSAYPQYILPGGKPLLLDGICFSLQQWLIFHSPVFYGGAPLREASHQHCCIFRHSLSHIVCSPPFWDFAFARKLCFSIVGRPFNSGNSDICSGNIEGGNLYDLQTESTLPPYSFHSVSIFPPYTLSLSFYLELPCGQIVVSEPLPQQEGRVGWSGGDYDSHRMRGEKTRKVAGNKVVLIRTCQQQSAHKAVWESNLVAAVSLSDISAISCHRSVCEPGALSDFLKSN